MNILILGVKYKCEAGYTWVKCLCSYDTDLERSAVVPEVWLSPFFNGFCIYFCWLLVMTTTNIQYLHPARSIHHEAGSIVSILQMVELRLSKEEGLAQGHMAGVLALGVEPRAMPAKPGPSPLCSTGFLRTTHPPTYALLSILFAGNRISRMRT